MIVKNLSNAPHESVWLKKYRIERGISQKEMAEILEIDPTTLSRIERGKGSRINNKIKVRLNELLKFTYRPILTKKYILFQNF